jgi:hypothetical protein
MTLCLLTITKMTFNVCQYHGVQQKQQNDTQLTEHHKNEILQNDTQIEELNGKAGENK